MDIQSLKTLALLGAHRKPLELSSMQFAAYIDSSQQTAARKIKALEEEDLIERQFLPDGQLISITKSGLDVLGRELRDYQEIFEGNGNIRTLNGRVVTGLGEGQYYISLEGYRKQFIEKLGFEPYPGTLNIKLNTSSIELRKKINENIRISGFSDQNRTFGNGSCFKIKISDIEGAVITPERTHYPDDIIEIIAPVNLRDHLNLRDGNNVNVEVLK